MRSFRTRWWARRKVSLKWSACLPENLGLAGSFCDVTEVDVKTALWKTPKCFEKRQNIASPEMPQNQGHLSLLVKSKISYNFSIKFWAIWALDEVNLTNIKGRTTSRTFSLLLVMHFFPPEVMNLPAHFVTEFNEIGLKWKFIKF